MKIKKCNNFFFQFFNFSSIIYFFKNICYKLRNIQHLTVDSCIKEKKGNIFVFKKKIK